MIDWYIQSIKLVFHQAAAGNGQFIVIAVLLAISLYIIGRLVISLLQERVIQIAVVLIVAAVFLFRR